ncbi:E3 ubiquitin ligase BIG BROTHER-related-like [Forsythia ovata]|uniref:RING-type E3 ubiquitin transferase n=1 Tax=Forsythia ovata TaxID=205694 RepID=A0ABD1R4V6_9LAMI
MDDPYRPVYSPSTYVPRPIQGHSGQTSLGSDNDTVILDEFDEMVAPRHIQVREEIERYLRHSDQTSIGSYDDTIIFDELAEMVGGLEWEDSNHTGFSEETIQQHLEIRNFVKIKVENAINEGPEICVVCQIEYEENEKIGSLVCGHEYHIGCIKKWLSRKTDCPICKAKAFPTDKEN